MFSGLVCFHDQIRVGIVTGENRNRIDVRVVDDRIIIRSCIVKAEFLACMLGMESARGGNANQFDAARLFDGGQQDGVSEETSAEDAQLDDGR